MSSRSYQNRLKDISDLRKEVYALTTSKESIVYDNEMMQSEYDRMKSEVEAIETKSLKRLVIAAVWAGLFIGSLIAWHL